MIAGSRFRGEFEERLKAVMDEVQRARGEIIMMIDELHTVVGAGAAQGAMDASNMLKPALARGELLNSYAKRIILCPSQQYDTVGNDDECDQD